MKVFLISNRLDLLYRVFYGFGKVKRGCDPLILDTSQFLLLPQLPQKNGTQFKRGQN